MAYDGELFLRDDPTILLKRLMAYFEPYPAKKISRWVGCTESTAENFKRGTSWPNARHWQLIVRHFGRDVLSAVFEPEIDETLARLRREERELREKLHEIEARRRKALGDLAEFEERDHPASDRSPLDRDMFEARP